MKLAPLLFGLTTLIVTATSSAYAAEGKFKVVTTFTVIADMAQERGWRRRHRGVDHQAWGGDPQLPADARRHPAGAGCSARPVERPQP